MILGLEGTPIAVALISVIGVTIPVLFGYLGTRNQLQKAAVHVTDEVSKLDTVNTSQHAYNAEILHRMLDTITEHGILVSTIVNAQDRPIIKTAPDGALLQVNAAGVKLLGMTPAELSGDGWIKAIHPEDRHLVFTTWQNCVRDKSPFGPLAYRYLHPTTKVVTLVEAMATPVINTTTGEILSWVAVVVPVTETPS